MRRAWTVAALATLLAASLLSGAASATDGDLQGTLETPGELALDGITAASLDRGVLHLRTSALAPDALTLEAERMEATVSWQEGYRTDADGRQVRYHTASGQDTHVLQDVELSVSTLQPNPEILAMAGPDAALSGSTEGSARVDVVEDEAITQVEWSDSAERSDGKDAPGFWYNVDGPWVRLAGLSQGSTTGSFDLFVNNVTLTAQTPNGTWEHWTGYRASNPDAPVSGFETRVTVLHVDNATLSVSSPGQVSVLGSHADASVDGTVSATQVAGELLASDQRLIFDEAPLTMEGSGALDLRTVAAGTSAQGAFDQHDDHQLVLSPDGAFHVTDAPGIVQAPLDDAASDDGSLPWAWILGGLLVLAGTVAVANRTRALSAVDEVRAQVRERRVEQWMQTGDRLTSVRDYERALTWYQRVTERYPTVTEAWYAQAVALQELGRHSEAADAYAEANELLGGDDPELLDLAAAAAWRAGEHELGSERFRKLARIDPIRLRDRIQDAAFADVADEPWFEEILGPDEEASVPYA